MAQRKDSNRLLHLLDTQQFFQAFIFSSQRHELWISWQKEQKKRAFRLDLPSIANYWNRNTLPKNSRRVWGGGKELPQAAMVLLRVQLKELCQLCQCEDHILRNFAFEVLLRQPLLLHWQVLRGKRQQKWLDCCAIPNLESGQKAEPAGNQANSGDKTGEFSGDHPAQQQNKNSASAEDLLAALKHELAGLFPYLLLALEDPEHYIREKFCTLIGTCFPHKLSQEHVDVWNGETVPTPTQFGTTPRDDLRHRMHRDIRQNIRQKTEKRQTGQAGRQVEGEQEAVWSSLRRQLYQKLLYCALNDSVYRVRHSATEEIKRHFMDLFQIQRKQLDWRKQRYFVELFDIYSAYHRKIAWEILRHVLLCKADLVQEQDIFEPDEADEKTGDLGEWSEKPESGESPVPELGQVGHENTDVTELALLEIKLLHFLDISGELFTLLVDCTQISSKVSRGFFEKQVVSQNKETNLRIAAMTGEASSVLAEAQERNFAWSLGVLFRALELKHNRFLQVWLKSGISVAQNSGRSRVAAGRQSAAEDQNLVLQSTAARDSGEEEVLLQNAGSDWESRELSLELQQDYWNGQAVMAFHGSHISQVFSSRSGKNSAASNAGKGQIRHQSGQQSVDAGRSAALLALSSAQDILRWNLQQFDAHSWILLLELSAYSQDSESLEDLSCLLLNRIQDLVLNNDKEGARWRWADLIRLFSEFVREQEVLQRKTEQPEQIFAWLKLRAQSFAREAESLWQGSPQKAESYSRQFGLLLALSAWRLCIDCMPLSSSYAVLRRYVAQIHSLTDRIMGSRAKDRQSRRVESFRPMLTLLLLAMPSMSRVSRMKTKTANEQEVKSSKGENKEASLNAVDTFGSDSAAFAGERQIYSYLIDLACIPFFHSFEALRIALRRFHSASYILDLEAQLQYQQCCWQEGAWTVPHEVRPKAATKAVSKSKFGANKVQGLMRSLPRTRMATQRDYEQVCQQLLCLLLDSGQQAILPIVIEQLHYFSEEQITQYGQLFSQYDRILLLSLCRQLLGQNERGFHQALLSLIANLGLLELGSEVRQLLQANVPNLRQKAYHCLWQLGIHKARQNYIQYRFRGLASSIGDLQRFLQQQFLQFAGTELHQVLRESQGFLRESQAWEMLCHTRSQTLFPSGDEAARGLEQWGGLNMSLAAIFQEICGEQLLQSEAQQKDLFMQLGWESVLQLAAETLLFYYIQVENFPEDMLFSYLQVAKRWKESNSVTLLLHIALVARGQSRNSGKSQGKESGKSRKIGGTAETQLYPEVWKAMRWKVQEGHGLLVLLHYLYFSLHYYVCSQVGFQETATKIGVRKDTEAATATQPQGLNPVLQQFGLVPVESSGSVGSSEVLPQWCRAVDVSGVLRTETEEPSLADKYSWLYRVEGSKFYLFCTLLHKQDLLQLRKFLSQLPSQGLHMVRDFLLAIYEPECEQVFGWNFSSLVSRNPDSVRASKPKSSMAEAEVRGSEWEHYTLWQFAKEFHRKDMAELREHCRRLCVDLLEASGYLGDLIGLLYQSRRNFPRLRGADGFLLASTGNTFLSLGNWLEAEAELDGRMAKALWQHQKLQMLMLLALCRTEMSYVGLALFQRDTQLALREYALAELQGLLCRAEAEAGAGEADQGKGDMEELLGQPKVTWSEIIAHLNSEDICYKDWIQAQRYLYKHPIQDYSENLLLELQLTERSLEQTAAQG